MKAPVPITPWHWVGFILVMLVFVAVDLRIFHRSARVVRLREALLWSSFWFMLAILFARGLQQWRGPEESLEFLTGYLVEFSLSMDNILAMALIFAFFGVAGELQHRVLFWGILGALFMRGMMIGVGVALILTFNWLFYFLGAFLLLTGIKWGFSQQVVGSVGENRILRLARKWLPIAPCFDGEKFFTVFQGRRVLTPLALALLMIEATDLIFAVDSVPAVFAVTQNAFIVFTSNIFAILGLRSLYFVLSGAIHYFRFLKPGLALVLMFVGLRMFLRRWYVLPTPFALGVVMIILGMSICLSVVSFWAKPGGKRDDAPIP